MHSFFTTSRPDLTGVQSKILEALAGGATMTAAAAACNLHRSTLYNWIKLNSAFRNGVQDARTESFLDNCEQRQELHAFAWSALRELLLSPDTPPAVRLRTAALVLKTRYEAPELWEYNEAPASGQTVPSVESVESVESAAVSKNARSPSAAVPTDAAGRTPAAATPKNSVDSVESVEMTKRSQIARGAPCPCGSGIKFKRCCGRNAPPLLHKVA